MEDRRERLLAKRVPLADVVIGRAYLIHARNGGVGVAVLEDGQVGYRLHRVKFDRHYLFVEWDWDIGEPHGTAIPLHLLDDLPPDDDDALLAWLADREGEHQEEVRANWEVVIGFKLP